MADEQPQPNLQPLFDKLHEVFLDSEQPLLDYGWRVDYERWGIAGEGNFVSVHELRRMAPELEDMFMGPPPVREPGWTLEEITPEERAKIAERPLEDLLDAEGLELMRREKIPPEVVRQLIRDGELGPKCRRILPAEDVLAALGALESAIDSEVWLSACRYRQKHPGATFEQWVAELARADIPHQKSAPRETWARLETEQPYPGERPKS